jgi:hypothetical protein
MLLNMIFWVLTPYNLVGYNQCFTGSAYLFQKRGQSSVPLHGIITWKTVSEMFVTLKTTNLRYSGRPFQSY